MQVFLCQLLLRAQLLNDAFQDRVAALVGRHASHAAYGSKVIFSYYVDSYVLSHVINAYLCCFYAAIKHSNQIRWAGLRSTTRIPQLLRWRADGCL